MAEPVQVTFLGGLGDIGRNCAAIETEGQLLILDCGQMFPDDLHPGVDSILPDLSYLRERADSIIGCITTHGHEDHIGALAHILPHASFPIHGSAFTLGMLRSRLEEAGVADRAELIPLADGERRQIGPFDCEFIPVTHSVPGGLISAINTAQGLILHSSDFKLDLHPVDGRRTDLRRIGSLAHDPGIRLMLADSTNAEVPGSTKSETEIGRVLEEVFRDQEGRRIITASFASHLHRVQQIANAAITTGRRIATLGLSMKRNVALGRELGVLQIPDHALLDIADIGDLDPGETCIISTGSQAEPRASLSVAAFGNSRWIEIGPDDTVVLSSHPIPGNEARVSRVINALVESGARVVHSGELDLHTSGHGKRDELTTLHSVATPEWFVPVHGELRHMNAHAGLAASLGMPDDHILVARDGDRVVLTDDGVRLDQGVTSGEYLLVHGPVVAPDDGVVKERHVLGGDGVVMVTVLLNDEGKPAGYPTVTSRGWLDGSVLPEMEGGVAEAVAKALAGVSDESDRDQLTRKIRRAAGKQVDASTRRRPMIVPVLIDRDPAS
jgi:ribonuclease J